MRQAIAETFDVEGDGPAAETPLYELIELMFFAYRDFVGDADRLLAGDGFGRAHHRVLYFAARRPGLTIAELLDILKITKQSLNRVLKDLIDRGYVRNELGEADRRQRRLTATPRGAALIDEIAAVQSARLAQAFASLGPGGERQAATFLSAMVGPVPADGSAPIMAAAARTAAPRSVRREIGASAGSLRPDGPGGR